METEKEVLNFFKENPETVAIRCGEVLNIPAVSVRRILIKNALSTQSKLLRYKQLQELIKEDQKNQMEKLDFNNTIRCEIKNDVIIECRKQGLPLNIIHDLISADINILRKIKSLDSKYLNIYLNVIDKFEDGILKPFSKRTPYISPHRMPVKYTDSQLIALGFYKQGKTLREIGEKMEVSHQMVHKLLRRSWYYKVDLVQKKAINKYQKFLGKFHCFCCNGVFGLNEEAAAKNKLCKKCVGKKAKIYSKSVAVYETFYQKLHPVEKTRKDPKNKNLLQVKCTYCGRWYNPLVQDVKSRHLAIEGKTKSLGIMSRLYCSDCCKKACPTFNRRTRLNTYKKNSSREVQAELRQLVLERDDYTCQKCGTTDAQLHCHHITGVEQNPLESADVDNCIILCKECHKAVHKEGGCRYVDLWCKSL